SPLTIATQNGHSDAVKVLLAAGADIELTRPVAYGVTALWTAASAGWEHIVKLLLENGAIPDSRPNDWRSPIEVAKERKYERIFDLLLE
ncbi:ankyrin repeat protein, partial [Zopfia rhizophila CBS 207.26]